MACLAEQVCHPHLILYASDSTILDCCFSDCAKVQAKIAVYLHELHSLMLLWGPDQMLLMCSPCMRILRLLR